MNLENWLKQVSNQKWSYGLATTGWSSDFFVVFYEITFHQYALSLLSQKPQLQAVCWLPCCLPKPLQSRLCLRAASTPALLINTHPDYRTLDLFGTDLQYSYKWRHYCVNPFLNDIWYKDHNEVLVIQKIYKSLNYNKCLIDELGWIVKMCCIYCVEIKCASELFEHSFIYH